MADGRITTMAALAGLLVVLLGIIPTQQQRLDANATNTSAFNATEAVVTTSAELAPLVILALAAGAILMGTGILGTFR